jgi:hypothetical protein
VGAAGIAQAPVASVDALHLLKISLTLIRSMTRLLELFACRTGLDASGEVEHTEGHSAANRLGRLSAETPAAIRRCCCGALLLSCFARRVHLVHTAASPDLRPEEFLEQAELVSGNGHAHAAVSAKAVLYRGSPRTCRRRTAGANLCSCSTQRSSPHSPMYTAASF